MESKTLLVVLQLLAVFYSRLQYSMASPMIGFNIGEVDELEFPSVVCIVIAYEHSQNNLIQFEDDILCTGTLISLAHVVTAEHCSRAMTDYKIEVMVGSPDVRRGTRHVIFWWITQNQWAISQQRRNRYIVNDISIIKLLLPVSNQIVPAVLSTQPKRYLIGLDCKIAGWGKLNNGATPMIMHAANVTVISDSDCMDVFRRFSQESYHIPVSDLCSIAFPYTLLEFGDSGGPLFHDNVLIGINLGTFPTCDVTHHPEMANIHVIIHYYRYFLNEMLEI